MIVATSTVLALFGVGGEAELDTDAAYHTTFYEDGEQPVEVIGEFVGADELASAAREAVIAADGGTVVVVWQGEIDRSSSTVGGAHITDFWEEGSTSDLVVLQLDEEGNTLGGYWLEPVGDPDLGLILPTEWPGQFGPFDQGVWAPTDAGAIQFAAPTCTVPIEPPFDLADGARVHTLYSAVGAFQVGIYDHHWHVGMLTVVQAGAMVEGCPITRINGFAEDTESWRWEYPGSFPSQFTLRPYPMHGAPLAGGAWEVHDYEAFGPNTPSQMSFHHSWWRLHSHGAPEDIWVGRTVHHQGHAQTPRMVGPAFNTPDQVSMSWVASSSAPLVGGQILLDPQHPPTFIGSGDPGAPHPTITTTAHTSLP